MGNSLLDVTSVEGTTLMYIHLCCHCLRLAVSPISNATVLNTTFIPLAKHREEQEGSDDGLSPLLVDQTTRARTSGVMKTW